VDAFAERDARAVQVRADGVERAYEGTGVGLFLAAGRFAERAVAHDERLADLVRRDPLAAAREATGRADATADLAATTGLAEGARRLDGYDDLRPFVGPTVARSRVRRRAPDGARLRERRTLDTGATVRLYDAPGGARYHLRPPTADLGADALATLAAAHDRLSAGAVDGGRRAPGRAVRRVAGDDDPVEALTGVLRRHTRGLGVLEHPLADPAVSDVFVAAATDDAPVRVRLDDERLRTNVRPTPGGTAALASRVRRVGGRAFSRATPTVDATLEPVEADERVRVAGVTPPASDGLAFALRSHGREAWTLPALVANDTLPADAAALLSVAVQRGASVVVAGPRGAGKTATLGALLFELPATTRTVIVEDTPELPVDALRDAGRDVQPLRSDPGDGPELSPTAAVRTALRLGRGALVVGEVRGEEAAALYEAMRVGANESAVLGTVHGDGARAVRERVVTDLGVPESSFAATDLVVTLAAGERRRLESVEEVASAGDGTVFEPLFVPGEDGAEPTGTVDRGNSRAVAALARPDESYADVRAVLDAREERLDGLARTERTAPAEVARANRRRDRSAPAADGETAGSDPDATGPSGGER
jgi:type IV secretory pathway ATPase VirB11/archaellum biosynthesis ATPase